MRDAADRGCGGLRMPLRLNRRKHFRGGGGVNRGGGPCARKRSIRVPSPFRQSTVQIKGLTRLYLHFRVPKIFKKKSQPFYEPVRFKRHFGRRPGPDRK